VQIPLTRAERRTFDAIRYSFSAGEGYPEPWHVSYDEDSRWCQDHGHPGILAGCEICDRLVQLHPQFAATVGVAHNPDGSPVR